MIRIKQTEENLQCGRGDLPSKAGGGGAASDKKINEVKNEPSGTHDDLPEYRSGREATSQKLQELTGMSEVEAKDSMKAITGYTQEQSVIIRDYQYGKTQEMSIYEVEKAKRDVEAINRYLDKMPKFKGEISRGKDFATQKEAEEFLSKLKQEAPYTLPAMSSFSSAQSTAEKFAKMRTTVTGNKARVPMVMIVESNKSGASIKSLSEATKENEVLVPKGAKYKLKGEPYQKDGIWYVPLKEVS